MSGGSQYNSPGGAVRVSFVSSRLLAVYIDASTLQRTAAQSLRPVTVKQVHSATQAHTDAEWMLEDMEIGQVSLTLFLYPEMLCSALLSRSLWSLK